MGTSSLALFVLPTHWPTDWLILGVVVAFLALESFRSGSSRTSTLAISLPLALLADAWLSTSAIGGNIVAGLTFPFAQAAVFAVIFVIFFLLIYRIVFSFGAGGGSILQAVICGFSATIILVVVWLLVPGLQDLWHFNTTIQNVFGENYRVWWLLASYLALAFARS